MTGARGAPPEKRAAARGGASGSEQKNTAKKHTPNAARVLPFFARNGTNPTPERMLVWRVASGADPRQAGLAPEKIEILIAWLRFFGHQEIAQQHPDGTVTRTPLHALRTTMRPGGKP